MISKTRIKKKTERKKDNSLVDTINSARKHAPWMKIAHILSGPKRKYAEVSLGEIEKKSVSGETLVIPGKVLGTGNIIKKIRVCALGFSSSARIKLKSSKSESASILEEINKNPKAQGVKIIYE